MRRLSLLLAFALLSTGCMGAVQDDPLGSASTPAGATVWERGLAATFDTPAIAQTRSAEERRADVSPPGSPEFAAFDAAVQAFMARYQIPAGQIALMHDGKLRYERGFGHVDEAGSTPTDALTMFRVASVSKPIAGAVVAMQIEEGLYNWSDPVFCLPPEPAAGCRLDIPVHPAKPLQDERLREITVAMLLDHTAGWGRPADPNLWGADNVEIAKTLGIPSPPPGWRIAQFMLGEELAYDPGTNDQYCNMCYLMLGLIAESASGADIRALEEAYVFRPLGVSGDIEGGFGRPEDRNAREPYYLCERPDAPSVYEPGKTGCAADVAFAIEELVSVGGLISTASAMAAIYEVYESVFSTDAGPVHTNGHGGSLPGTAAFVGTVEAPGVGEVQYAAFFNGHDAMDLDPGGIYTLEFAILAAASAWGATQTP